MGPRCGQSSLLGLLLGWYAPLPHVRVDGAALEGAIRQLRRCGVEDPAVAAMESLLFFNLCWQPGRCASSYLLEQAELRSCLRNCPMDCRRNWGKRWAGFRRRGQRVDLDRALRARHAGCACPARLKPFGDWIGTETKVAGARSLTGMARCGSGYARCRRTLGFPRAHWWRMAGSSGRRSGRAARQSVLVIELSWKREVREGSWSSGHWRHLRLKRRLVEELQGPRYKESLAFLVTV